MSIQFIFLPFFTISSPLFLLAAKIYYIHMKIITEFFAYQIKQDTETKGAEIIMVMQLLFKSSVLEYIKSVVSFLLNILVQ